jgi:hypothetical protein
MIESVEACFGLVHRLPARLDRAFERRSTVYPHKALGYCSPREFRI